MHAVCIHAKLFMQGLEDYINTYIDDDTWRIPIVLAGVRCDGSEASLLDCPGGTLEDDNIPCELPDEVGLICVNDPDAGSLSLVYAPCMHCR